MIQNSWKKRYRGIIISSILFIFSLLIFFGAQQFFAHTNNHNHEIQNKLITTAYHLMDLDKSTHDALLHMSEKPQEAITATLMDNLNNQVNYIHALIQELEQGMKVYQYNFRLGSLQELDNNNLINSILTEWKATQSKVSPLLSQSAFPYDDTLRYKLLEVDTHVDLLISYYRLLNTLVTQSAGDSELAQNIIMVTRIFIAILYLFLLFFIFIRRLRQQDQEMMTIHQDYQSILDSVHEGLFLIDLNFNVSTQYSKALHQYVQFKPRHQMNLYHVLDDLVPKSQIQLLERFLKQVLNPRIKQNLIGDLNPLNNIQVRQADGEDRWLSFQFRRVIDAESKKITGILASVRDTTENITTEKRLENEREHSDMQLEMLTTILRVDHQLLESFIRNVVAGSNRMNGILRRPALRSIDFRSKIEDLFREAHLLKGEASALDLRLFVNLTTKMEDKLQILSKQEHLRGNDFFGFTIDLEDLMSSVEKTEQLLKRLGGIKVENAEQLAREIHQATENNASLLMQYFEQFSQDIATRQGKLVTLEMAGFDQHTLDNDKLDILKEIMIQLVRNAIVHGIENPKQRKAIGKNPEGVVHIELNAHGEQFELCVSDDGAGINLEALREKAAVLPEFMGQDIKALSPKALYPILFVSGFSTAVHVTEDAGQGVGMGAVRERLQAINGKLGIESEAGAYTRFHIRFS
ncbi:MAG: ATP-binding protein [Cardiobacteriaceae bacterium]|nr:ATP-binding protein [Cardiobacteriaceae bacterium]